MSRSVELIRYVLEEIDNIEQAICDRLKRNPNILPDDLKSGYQIQGNGKRQYKETLLQQHEVAFFQEQYKKHCSTIKKYLNDNQEIEQDLSSINDSNQSFEKFDEIVEAVKSKHAMENLSELRYTEDLRKLYSMYSSNKDDPKIDYKSGKKRVKVKRKYVLSQAGEHIDLNQIFSEEERLGKQLDLLSFYDRYKILQPESSTYLEYLKTFHEPLPEKLKEYTAYLHDLKDYLISFIKRSQPFYDIDALSKSLEDKYQENKSSKQDGTKNDDGLVYCKACDKLFTKESVYNGHLSGKKHKKNSQIGSIELPSSKYEFLIDQLAQFLSKYREAAISNAERYSSMTDREKLIEMNAMVGDELDYTTLNESEDSDESKSDDDDDDDIQNLKDLPLGVDGKPMPYWLFKLQGLNKTYSCEICGNISYKGRVAFDKHFGSNKHQYGLKCLGIANEYMKLFVNIDKIDEASSLWARLKKANKIKQGDQLNAIEVEDDQGNVMSEKDYLDLKKQGLL